MGIEKTIPQTISANAFEEHNKKVGFAIAGLGELTETQLLPAFAFCKYAQPVALISDDIEKMDGIAHQYNIESSHIYSYDDFDIIAQNKHIDVVYIVLPNAMHKEFTIRAAKAGKHVLCEKPMATSVSEARAMIEACKSEDRKLMIAYRIQLEPHHRIMKDWVQQHIFGKVKIIDCFNGQYIGDASQWRFKRSLAGGGVLMDLGIYCVNTLRYLTGEEPDWVSANIYSTPADERFKEVEETVLFQMGFSNGIIASCGTSYGIHSCQRYRCFAEKDAWFGMDPAFPYNGLKIEISPTNGGKEFPVPAVAEENQFALVMDHMAQCVLKDHEPVTPGEEGLKDQLVIDAIYRSAKEGRVVQLNEILQTEPKFVSWTQFIS